MRSDHQSLGALGMILSAVAIAAITLGCGESGGAGASASGAVASASGKAVGSASARSASAKAAPVPPELRAKLEAGAGCKWSDEGLMQSCEADEPLKKYVEANRTAATLDGCLAAMQDKVPAMRVMASACVYDFYFGNADPEAKETVARTFDAALAAIETETEPGVRGALATAIWQRDAVGAGKADAVIATLKKLDPAKDGHVMAFAVASLYSFGMTEEPPKGALDLAPSLAASPHADLRKQAYGLMRYAPSRAQTSCPLLGRAIAEDRAMWNEALGALTGLGKACEKEAGAVHEAILARFERATGPAHKPEEEIVMWGELRGYVGWELATPEQREAVAKAAEKLAKAPKTSATHREYATKLAALARGQGDAKK